MDYKDPNSKLTNRQYVKTRQSVRNTRPLWDSNRDCKIDKRRGKTRRIRNDERRMQDKINGKIKAKITKQDG